MLKFIAVLLVCSSVACFQLPSAGEPVPPKKAAPALAAATKLSWQGMSFTIQPPKEFELSVELGVGGGANFFWAGKQRADGSRPLLTVMPVVRGKADAGLTATQFIDAWFESGKKKADAMDKTPAEEVTVSGRKFTCVNYRRVSDGKQFNGFIAATSAKKGIFA